MKKQSIQGGLKKVITAAAVTTGMLLVSAVSGNAATLKDSVATTVKTNYVQFVNTVEDGVWFNVRYDNPKGEKFTLLIRNSDGDVVYQGSFSDVNFSKKIKVLKEDNETLIPTFIIKTADNKKIAQAFEVNTFSNKVQNVIVTRY